MKSNMVTGIAAAVALGLVGIVWLLSPSLQFAQRTVDYKAGELVSRAQRVLHRYNPWLTYRSAVTERQVDGPSMGDPTALSEEAGLAYQKYHTEAWEAYQPKDWPNDVAVERPNPKRANYGDISGQVRKGLAGMDQMVAANDKVLAEALGIVNEALAVSSGDINARDHIEANRLKGVILFYQGQAEQIKAQIIRGDALGMRQSLRALAAELPTLKASTGLVEQSAIDGQIETLRTRAGEAAEEITADRTALAELEQKIQSLQNELDAAQATADQARIEMDKIRAEGIDFADPHGGEAFEKRYAAQDQIYRDALRQVRMLKYATDADNVQFGLTHYEDKRDVLAAQLDGREKALDDLRADIGRLEGIKEVYAVAERTAVQRLERIRSDAATAYENLAGIDADAADAEDKAINIFNNSLEAFKQATTAAEAWTREGSSLAGKLSPEVKGRSAHQARGNDRWLPGYIKAHQADVQLAIAWIQSDRYRAIQEDMATLAAVQESLELEGVDTAVLEADAATAQEEGVAAVRQAMSTLEKAHRDANNQWTLVAQQASTVYLMNLLGHDYMTDTINAYRQAIDGREDKIAAQPYVERLNQLEGA